MIFCNNHNCFIICFIISYVNHSITAQGSELPFFTQESMGMITDEQTVICSKTHFDSKIVISKSDKREA